MFVESYYYGNLYVVMFLQFAEAVNTEPCMAIRTQHVAKYRRYVRKRLMDKCKTDKEICQSFCSRPCSNKQMGECRECVNAIYRVCASPLGRLECHMIGEVLICPYCDSRIDWTTVFSRFIPAQGVRGRAPTPHSGPPHPYIYEIYTNFICAHIMMVGEKLK